MFIELNPPFCFPKRLNFSQIFVYFMVTIRCFIFKTIFFDINVLGSFKGSSDVINRNRIHPKRKTKDIIITLKLDI